MPRVDYTAQVAALGLGGRLSVRHWVDDETLTTLYAQATAFAFLSEYEGFGFTPLEALAHGAVPVVLDTPVAREIYGDAAVRLTDGPDLVGAVAAALGGLLADPAARTPYLAAAPTVLASYRWAETAARTWRYLEEAAGADASLAIVIVSHNVRAELEQCLRSLAAHPPARTTTIAVVDNASSDGTLEAVARQWPQVQASPPAATSASPAPTTWGLPPRAATSCCC